MMAMRGGYDTCCYTSVIVCLLLLNFVQCTIIEGPSDVIYFPGVTPLPIELTCTVTGVALWSVNNTDYTLSSLSFGALPEHSRNGTNILINSPMDNTEYICVSATNDGDVSSDPAYIIMAGTVIEEPSSVTYIPGVTPLPIELTCNVNGTAAWRVNGSSYTLAELTNGVLPEHSRNGTNILVDSPVNNTEYICVSATNDGETRVYVIIAGVPAMVPGVTVDINTININGNSVTLTLSWGEPLNILDSIVNYTVSCSGDVTCPPNFTTTDNTTRSYTFTNLTTMTNYTFSVVATNSIGSGEAGLVMITTPAIGKVTGVTVFCGPVSLINMCTIMWKPVTPGDITDYQVYYSGTMMNVTSSTTTLTLPAPLLPDGVFTDTVVVVVTAINQHGVGPDSNSAIAEIRVSSSVTDTTTALISPNLTSEIYDITITCTIHPDSTAGQCVVMVMADGRETRNGTAPIINGTATVTVSGLECGVTYTITAGGTLNEDLVGPRSSHGTITAGPCPIDMTNNELSRGLAVAISIVVTFIITLVVTTLISVIVTSLYYKYWYELKEKVKVDDDKNVNTKQDPYGDNITMATNPAYGTTDTINMHTNPAYATTSH